MERMWAPWRMSYLKGGDSAMRAGCIFCDFPALNSDSEYGILFRGKSAFVILNAYPYSNGHLMVVPFRHAADLSELTDEELAEINHLVRDCCRWISEAYNPQGFNIGVNVGSAAGAGIPGHVHWHIVPRWSGDTNFMTVTGETRVIPQSLEETFAAISARIAQE